ncbi:MAG: AAA family ATPase [Thaumarchaeota archaeon]|nr:AAA family ATPase [Nitrososphaerota archaeon]
MGRTRFMITTVKLREQRKTHLSSEYDISQYDLLQGHRFPLETSRLIPSNTPEYVDEGQKYVERIMRALSFFKQCALIGPSGTGKTHIVYLVAELAGLPMWEINCGLQTSSYDLFGRYIGLGKGNWIDGQIVSWCRQGGILYLDEANMMRQDVATRLNPLLDTRGHLVLNEKDNEVIPRHPRGYLIASMNPFSAEFAGTKPLNAAFRRRMTVWLNFDYLSVGDKLSAREVQLVRTRGGVDEITARKIVSAAAELRQQYKSGDLPYAPSVADLMNWGKLCAHGVSPTLAAQETVVAMTSDSVEIQEMVQEVVNGVFNRR